MDSPVHTYRDHGEETPWLLPWIGGAATVNPEARRYKYDSEVCAEADRRGRGGRPPRAAVRRDVRVLARLSIRPGRSQDEGDDHRGQDNDVMAFHQLANGQIPTPTDHHPVNASATARNTTHRYRGSLPLQASHEANSPEPVVIEGRSAGPTVATRQKGLQKI